MSHSVLQVGGKEHSLRITPSDNALQHMDKCKPALLHTAISKSLVSF